MLGSEGYVFPSARSSSWPMSENTLNAAFRGMGYSKEEVTAHGLRATASTMLNESGLWSADAIERGRAHNDGNAIPAVDDVTRECLAAVPDTSISGRRVVRELTELIARRGKPGMIVSDNVLCWEAAAGTGQQISLRRV